METGTGKTYCYINTMFELSRRYGWTKFIVVVPSIAIREGVQKAFEITAEHFLEQYAKRARFFIYNSKRLHELESYSLDAGINAMIINVQAFNASGNDARRIYEELDDFQSRRPIDVIKANHPILILDEPQKMEGKRTLDSLREFNPLMILRYSATHKTQHNKVKHVYFIAEPKGSMSTMELREIERRKIECARKFFAKITSDQVKYDVVDSYGKLMELVS